MTLLGTIETNLCCCSECRRTIINSKRAQAEANKVTPETPSKAKGSAQDVINQEESKEI